MKRTHKLMALLLSLALAVTICAPGMLAADAAPSQPASISDAAPAADSNSLADSVPAADSNSVADSVPTADSNSVADSVPAADSNSVADSAPAADSNSVANSAPVESTDPVVDEVQPTLFEKLMAIEDDAVFAQALTAVSEEEAAQLSEEEIAALKERLTAWEDAQPRTEPETVCVTDPGPFMPAVNVAMQRMLRTFSLPADEGPLHLDKQAVANEDGTYTITMEAYTTGTVTSTEKVNPVDIVLVLDQSGSMNFSFSGSDNNSKERQNAMKQAVGKFIDSVGAKYSTAADHRIALVEFRGGAEVIKGWTSVDTKGVTSLKSKVNGLRAEGATNVGAGMQEAEKLMGSGYNYRGYNTERQKVVIVFTDGVPTTSSEFHTGVANTAIQSAKNMKADGVTIYSVGIFKGANPDQTYGDKGFKKNSNGEVGSKWYNTSFLIFGDLNAADIPAGNRFLNYLSSNYKDASEIGLSKHEEGFIVQEYGWKITKNATRTASADEKYYLSANNSTDLDKIFEQISEQIATPGISLGSQAVIKDSITPYFTVPNAQDVKVYTAEFNGTSFEARQASGLEATVSGDTIAVTGFDFDKNFVSEIAKADGTYGQKLIIEVVVAPKDAFLGGNGVPTNKSDSGLYDKDGHIVGEFEVPAVDVPIKPITITVPDGYVYLNGTVANAKLRSLIGIKAGDIELDLVKGKAQSYGLEPWQAEFVTVSTPTAEESFTGIRNDMTYTVNVSLNPDQNGTQSGTENSADGSIKVLKPVITWKDSRINAGETADYAAQNFVKTEWKHGNTLDTAVAAKIVDTSTAAPVLSYTYDPEAAAFTTDTPVKVTVMMGELDATSHAKFVHEDCNFDGCKWGEPGFTEDDCQFIVHIDSFDLVITKSVTGEKMNSVDSFLFTITGPNGYTNTVVINNWGSVTIKGLPSGTYTVTEDTSWSWTYDVNGNASQTVSPDHIDGGVARVAFTNTAKTNIPLTEETYVDNFWSIRPR